MQDNEKKPALRFKGFTDPWEQRKLGDITVELSEYATQELGLPLLTSSRSGLMYQDEYRDSRTTKSTETLFSVVPVGTCTYRHMSDDDVFHMNINTLEKGLVSREYPVFEASKGNNLEFLVQHINSSEEFKAFCAEQKKGGTRTRLYYNTLCQFTVRVPALKEQAQISQCLKKLDTLITLHQRKYEKLVNIKKSMLDKMFPKNGASVPEIRFKGFTDPWEQRKLGDVADIVGGGTPSTNNPNYWDGDIDWYAPAEIAGQIYFDSSQRKITEQGYENSSAKMLPPGTVLFTSRAGIGKTAILSKKGCTNQGFQSIVPHNDELDSYFVFSRTDELKQYGELVGAGSTFVEVSGKQMAAMNLKMPTTIEEQQTIGRFFKRLDTLITLHQRKLEKLQNIKKSCLEKMFV